MDLLKIATDAQESHSMQGLSKVWDHYANSVDQSHGVDHIKSVLNNAMTIAKSHNVNPEDVHYAAVLHDIGRDADVREGTDIHEFRGLELAKPYIKHLPSERQELILDAIRHHRSTTGKPSTLLAKIISDADRLASSNLESIQRIHSYRKDKGLSDSDALKDGYWYLRHKKFKKIDGRSSLGLHLLESKALMSNKIDELKDRTSTFSGYQKLLGFNGSIPFK